LKFEFWSLYFHLGVSFFPGLAFNLYESSKLPLRKFQTFVKVNVSLKKKAGLRLISAFSPACFCLLMITENYNRLIICIIPMMFNVISGVIAN